MDVKVILETLDGVPFFVSKTVKHEIWEQIFLVLDGELEYIVLTGEDGFERIFPKAVLGEVVIRKGIPTESSNPAP